MIELHKLESEKRLDLLSLITYDLEKNKKFLPQLTKNQIKELIKKTNGYPNDI
jgi:ribosomal protein S17E